MAGKEAVFLVADIDALWLTNDLKRETPAVLQVPDLFRMRVNSFWTPIAPTTGSFLHAGSHPFPIGASDEFYPDLQPYRQVGRASEPCSIRPEGTEAP